MTMGKGAAEAWAFQQGQVPTVLAAGPLSLDRAPLAPALPNVQPKGGQLTASEGPDARLFASPPGHRSHLRCPGGWLRRSSQALLLILETALLSFWSLSLNDGGWQERQDTFFSFAQ